MLTPSESNDLLRGYFQLDSNSRLRDQSGCWDLTTLLSLPVERIESPGFNSLISRAPDELESTGTKWNDPDWDAYKFAEPRTIPRCWDVSSL